VPGHFNLTRRFAEAQANPLQEGFLSRPDIEEGAQALVFGDALPFELLAIRADR
jgi:hypothetical protein